jgi:hypothetical protein
LCPTSRLFEEPQFDIISIHPISVAESQAGRLIAVTANGARLYFTSTKSNSVEPASLQLTNVRLPVEKVGTNEPVAIVDVAFYMDGIFMAADKSKSRVLYVCPDAALMNGEKKMVNNSPVIVVLGAWSFKAMLFFLRAWIPLPNCMESFRSMEKFAL